MSRPLGTYSFLPWLRQGIARRIDAADLDEDVAARASVRVDLRLSGDPLAGGTAVQEPLGRDVELYGPGDVVGIDSRAIIRTEPRHWITNFEPNHLAAIEFYDEDFPWRYTPAGPDASGLRLRPWIALVVLAEGEFAEATNLPEGSGPFVTVPDLAVLPPAEELWAWAHVHVNRSLAGSNAEFVSADMGAVLPRMQAVLDENPDLAFSRIVCPRRLAENADYNAFLVPVFETGRLAALGKDPAAAPHATFSAWATYTDRTESPSLPYYHRWFFRTGAQGDFEQLVRLLRPKPVDKRVGTRDVDVRRPGSNLPGITDPELGGVLALGGALRVPRASFSAEELAEIEHREHWDEPYPHPFQRALASFVNLSDTYEALPPEQANAASGLGGDVEDDPDPLITAPLYGRWHALTRRLLFERDGTPVSPGDNWVHRLNLDPRHRMAAGFGTRVVQDSQEDYMNAAWEQIGDVLAANARIRAAQLAREAASIWYERHLQPLLAVAPERALTLTAPVQARVVSGGVTVRHLRSASLLPPVATSAPMRRAMRPGARLVRSLPFDDARRPQDLLARMNDGEVTAAPPKTAPPGAPNVDGITEAMLPGGVAAAGGDALRRHPWLAYLPYLLAAIIALPALVLLTLRRALVAAVLALTGAAALHRVLARWGRKARVAHTIGEEDQRPDAVDELPSIPDFVLTEPGSDYTPRPDGADSPVAARLKGALREWAQLEQASAATGEAPELQRLALLAVAERVVERVDPTTAIPSRALTGLRLPPRIAEELGDRFAEVMAYPVIDVPMYRPLAEISPELFLPNLNLVEQNSITLLETNQAFIEAYMVGVNHEFARELLWREYPTDQRGTSFRQFWDARTRLAPAGEDLHDVPPIHTWPRPSGLGDHDARERGGAVEQEVVVVIRGELLKKYPTAVIYAHRARWQRHPDGSIDPAQEREREPLATEEEDAPPLAKLRTPLYEAKLEPDLYFFGFDLTAEAARGGTGEDPDDEPGWFFVIKERPGEPRFGFDVERSGPLQTFNDLAWEDALPGGAPGGYLKATSLSAVTLTAPGAGDEEKVDQNADDLKVAVAPTSAARWAYLLSQAPVMVAVHGAEILGRS
jgi:hypothetical protein